MSSCHESLLSSRAAGSRGIGDYEKVPFIDSDDAVSVSPPEDDDDDDDGPCCSSSSENFCKSKEAGHHLSSGKKHKKHLHHHHHHRNISSSSSSFKVEVEESPDERCRLLASASAAVAAATAMNSAEHVPSPPCNLPTFDDPNATASLPNDASPAESSLTLPIICRSDQSDEQLHQAPVAAAATSSTIKIDETKRRADKASTSGSESNNNNNNSNKKQTQATPTAVKNGDAVMAVTRQQKVPRKTRFNDERNYTNPPQPVASATNSRPTFGRRRFANNLHNGGGGRISLPGTRHVPSRILCRNNSVQISSIRGGMDRLENVDRSKYLIPRIEYGGRLIDKKGGNSNVSITESSSLKLYSRYASDIFTTLIDMRLSYVLTLTMFVYVCQWIVFGLIYWLFAVLNDDVANILGKPDADGVLQTDEEAACVFNVYDFTTAFLFSMESETTIGYGNRGINTKCPHAIMALSVQCIVSAIFDTWIIGIVYQRFARPDARSKTTLFSKEAIITRRDGKRCLIVRVANLRKSLLVSTSIRARLISFRTALSDEKDVGYHVMSEQREIEFKNGETLFFTAPVEYYHVIDKDSPLYRVRPDQYDRSKKVYFELVVTFTGTLEATGMTMQAQTSYLNTDISYGKRFIPVLTRDPGRSRYVVDFANMHRTVDEPRNLYGRNAVDTHEGGGGTENGKFAWESSLAMPLTEEDENEEEENDDEAPQESKEGENSVRVRVDTYTSDDVFEESPSQSSPTSEMPPSGAGGGSDDSMV